MEKVWQVLCEELAALHNISPAGIDDDGWNAYLEKMNQMGLEELITLKQKGFDMFYELTNYEKAGE